VQEDSRGQTLLLTAQGLTSGATASATFTDAGVSFLQCANNQGANPLGECNWIGSILQQKQFYVFEGMSTLQRIYFTAINPVGTGGNNHVLNFKHQSTKGTSIHAYDFLTSWEQAFRVASDKGVPFLDITQTFVVAAADEDAGSTPPYLLTMTNAEACEQANGDVNADCEALRDNRPSVPPLPAANRFFCDVPIPAELGNTPLLNATETRAAAYEAIYGKRYLRIYGDAVFNSCSIAIDAVTLDNTDEVYIGYNLNWNSASTTVLIEIGGHLAEGTTAATGWGIGFGSSSINGGPYHFKFNSLDGDATGSKDNQIKGADILLQPKGAVTIRKQTVGGTGSFDYTASGTGVPTQVPAGFALDTAINNPASAAYSDIPAGNLTVVESGPPAGWNLTNIACTGDSDSGSIIGDGAGPNRMITTLMLVIIR
jgi:hypothetical protein